VEPRGEEREGEEGKGKRSTWRGGDVRLA